MPSADHPTPQAPKTPPPPAPREAPAQASPEAGPPTRQGRWMSHTARTTALLAVLAALSSAQYAGENSRTILAQAEASDSWSYYQGKSIKKQLREDRHQLLEALAISQPDRQAAFAKLEEEQVAEAKRYELELGEIKARAEALEAEKARHQSRSARFQYAFISLQAGVVLSTVAASSRRRSIWIA